jgi:hypothetical protein
VVRVSARGNDRRSVFEQHLIIVIRGARQEIVVVQVHILFVIRYQINDLRPCFEKGFLFVHRSFLFFLQRLGDPTPPSNWPLIHARNHSCGTASRDSVRPAHSSLGLLRSSEGKLDVELPGLREILTWNVELRGWSTIELRGCSAVEVRGWSAIELRGWSAALTKRIKECRVTVHINFIFLHLGNNLYFSN